MCYVSMVVDAWTRAAPGRYPGVVPDPTPTAVPPFPPLPAPPTTPVADVTRELERLRAEVEELRLLLAAAKRYDDATGQPDCEQEEKLTLLRRVAELVGVDLEAVLGGM